MNGQSGGVYLFGSLDGFWRCTGSGLHVLFVAISCYLAERDLDTIQSKLLAWQLHFWVVNEFLFLLTVNANFTFPEILYKLLGTNLFPHKEFTKSYKESSGLLACSNWHGTVSKIKAECKFLLVKMNFNPMRIKNRFHINGFALRLALEQRLGRTRKYPISITYKVMWLIMRCFHEVLLVIHKLLRNRAYKTVILSLRVLLGLL